MISELEQNAKLEEARHYLQNQVGVSPELGIILGSGLGSFADLVEEKVVIPYHKIPHFPVSTVEGHA